MNSVFKNEAYLNYCGILISNILGNKYYKWEIIDKIKKLQDGKLSDKLIIQKVAQHYAENPISSLDDGSRPSDGRYNSKMKCLKEWTNSASINGDIVDYGAGNGSISTQIAKDYGRNVSIVEIYEPPNLPDNVQLILDTAKIANGSVGLCIFLMVLHHIENTEEIMEILIRILGAGSYVYVQEHDCLNDEHAKFLDLLHVIYSYFSAENENAGTTLKERAYEDTRMDIGFTKYLNKDALIDLFERHGFNCVKSSPVSTHDIQRKYFALFKSAEAYAVEGGAGKSSEKYRAPKVKRAHGTELNLDGAPKQIKGLFKQKIKNAQFLINKFYMLQYGYYGEYAISPKDAYDIKLINCRLVNEEGNSIIFCQIMYSGMENNKQYSFEPSLGSQDGEYRGRIITEDLYQIFLKNGQFGELRKLMKEYLEKNNVNIETDYYGKHHHKDSLNIDALILNLLSMAIMVAQHRYLTKTGQNHKDVKYDQLLVNKELIEIYYRIAKKYEEGHWWFLRSYFNPKKGFFGRKIITMTVREILNAENILYGAWREYYISTKCNDLMLNEIAYGFPYYMDWLIIQGTNADMFSNKAIHKKYLNSKKVGDIINDLHSTNMKNYIGDENIGGRIPINTNFLKLSRKIENAISFAESYIFLSDLAMILQITYVGRTFRDIPKLIEHQAENIKKFPNTYDIYSSDIFADIDLFAKILFDYIYNLHAIHDKMKIIHGDVHLNNITLSLGGSIGRFLDKNPEKEFASVYVMKDPIGTFMFKGTHYLGNIIDFSRSIIGNREMIEFDFSKEDAQKFFKEQEPRIISLIGLHFESFVKKNYDKLRALVIDSLDLLFPILTALDYYVMAKAMKLYLSNVSEITISPAVISLVSSLESYMFTYLSDGLRHVINTGNNNDFSNFPIEKWLINNYSKYRIAPRSSKLPDDWSSKKFNLLSFTNMYKGINYTAFPPNLPHDIDEDVRNKLDENYSNRSYDELQFMGDKYSRKVNEFSISQSWKLDN